eukprot:scaffold485_cov272-Pinguiococcus_pyrenoidosus.AAC.12
MLNLSVLSAALSSSSADHLQVIDLSHNRNMFLLGMNTGVRYSAWLPVEEYPKDFKAMRPKPMDVICEEGALELDDFDEDEESVERGANATQDQSAEEKTTALPSPPAMEELGCPFLHNSRLPPKTASKEGAQTCPVVHKGGPTCPHDEKVAKSGIRRRVKDLVKDITIHSSRRTPEKQKKEHNEFENITVKLPFIDICGGVDNLFRSTTQLRKVDFQRTELPLPVFSDLIGALRMTTCEELDISVCNIHHRHCYELAQYLAQNTLRVLIMRYNEAGTHGAKHLAKALPHASKLEKLDIGWNAIGLEGAQTLINSIKSYIDINIDCNTIPHEAFVAVRQDLRGLLKEFNDIRRMNTELPPSDSILAGKTVCELIGGEEVVDQVVDRFVSAPSKPTRRVLSADSLLSDLPSISTS